MYDMVSSEGHIALGIFFKKKVNMFLLKTVTRYFKSFVSVP